MASTALNTMPHKSEEDRLRDRLKRRQETRRNPVIEPRRDDRRYYGPPPRARGTVDHRRDRPHPPPPRHERSRPPPSHYLRGPPPSRSSFHNGPQNRRNRSPSSSASRRSYSRSRSPRRYGRQSRSYSSDSYSSSQSEGTSYSSSSSSRSSRTESDIEDLSSKGKEENNGSNENNAATKDQRTVFVSQLVMRADERDLKNYFQKVLMCPVKEVIILRDKRNHRHKGCAYVELKRFEDISKALEASQKPPDFQRFPILIKASEAEKNHVHPSQLTLTAQQMGASVPKAPILRDGKLVEAQKVYIGNLDPSVSQELLYSIFSKFGFLDKVAIQLDPITGTSRGFAFLSFRDPKDANLAIHTMNTQVLAGRPLKTGWANQVATVPNVEIVTSTEFPDDATVRIQNAHLVLSQVSGNASIVSIRALQSTTSQSKEIAVVPSSDEPDAKIIGNASHPTTTILVRNMFDKDKETEPNWHEDIRLDFEEECAKWGKLVDVRVMHLEPGGKIFASFETISQAQICASNLAGRWFDKRQLRVAYVYGIPDE